MPPAKGCGMEITMIEILIMLIIGLLVFFYNFFLVTFWILVGIVVAVAVVIIVGAIWTKIKEERQLSWEECQSYRAEINKIYYIYTLKKKEIEDEYGYVDGFGYDHLRNSGKEKCKA